MDITKYLCSTIKVEYKGRTLGGQSLAENIKKAMSIHAREGGRFNVGFIGGEGYINIIYRHDIGS